MHKFTIKCDGASRGNPGESSIGVVLGDENNTVILEHSEYIGRSTNNEAEYIALRNGLNVVLNYLKDIKGIKDPGSVSLDIYSDSQLMVKQLTGEYRIKNNTLKQHYDEIKAITKTIGEVYISHIYREDNKLADALANIALDSRV